MRFAPTRSRSRSIRTWNNSMRRTRDVTLRGLSLPWGFVLDRDLCRDALPLDHHGETVILIHDPFDVTDQVVRHDGELKRIVPHQSKLGNRDVDRPVVALDLVLFFIFFEIVLVPMYFMIGIWGDKAPRKVPGFARAVSPFTSGEATARGAA